MPTAPSKVPGHKRPGRWVLPVREAEPHESRGRAGARKPVPLEPLLLAGLLGLLDRFLGGLLLGLPCLLDSLLGLLCGLLHLLGGLLGLLRCLLGRLRRLLGLLGRR